RTVAVGADNELPSSWNLADIDKAILPKSAKGRLYVLAWHIMEDHRPLRVESCLVLKELDDGYCLVHLYRHSPEWNPAWKQSMIHVMGEPGTKNFPGMWYWGYKCFKERPGNKEVYASLGWDEVNWSFKLEKGWRCINCCVCTKAWQEATG